MKTYSLDEIKERIRDRNLIANQEEAFRLYSQRKAILPAVGHLYFPDYSGECHIKSGFIKGNDVFVIKVATSYFDHVSKGIPPGNGLILVFDRTNGIPKAILQDQGYLTDLRTAIAGAIAAKYLAPKRIERVGIIGTGVQARFQIQFLKQVVQFDEVMIWGRNPEHAEKLAKSLGDLKLRGRRVDSPAEIAAQCNLIVTTTSSKTPLLFSEQIRPGTHITAVGADGNGKQELDPLIFRKADINVADSLTQCTSFGDLSFAVDAGLISRDSILELGQVLENPKRGRINDQQITVVDLTGLGVQDLQMANLVLHDSTRD